MPPHLGYLDTKFNPGSCPHHPNKLLALTVLDSIGLKTELMSAECELCAGVLATKWRIMNECTSGGTSIHPPSGQYGSLEFVSYVSSPLEKSFLAMLPEMPFPQHEARTPDRPVPPEYCAFVQKHEAQVRTWVKYVKVLSLQWSLEHVGANHRF
jgi:hypothetical protein